MTATPPAGVPITPAFTRAQRDTLDVLMDLLIPASPDGRMPAARSLGLYDAAGAMPAPMRALFDAGLAALDDQARDLHGAAFAALPDAQARALVQRWRAQGHPFVQAFVAQTVGRYVSHPTVMPLIGLPPRPLWPEGNTVAEGDWSLLATVQRRGKIFRPV